MKKPKRINILLNDELHERVVKEGLNLSGLIRDLLYDHFSNHKVTLSLSPKSRSLYDKVVSNFGASDRELEGYFLGALDQFLEEKSKEISKLRKQMK